MISRSLELLGRERAQKAKSDATHRRLELLERETSLRVAGEAATPCAGALAAEGPQFLGLDDELRFTFELPALVKAVTADCQPVIQAALFAVLGQSCSLANRPACEGGFARAEAVLGTDLPELRAGLADLCVDGAAEIRAERNEIVGADSESSMPRDPTVHPYGPEHDVPEHDEPELEPELEPEDTEPELEPEHDEPEDVELEQELEEDEPVLEEDQAWFHPDKPKKVVPSSQEGRFTSKTPFPWSTPFPGRPPYPDAGPWTFGDEGWGYHNSPEGYDLDELQRFTNVALTVYEDLSDTSRTTVLDEFDGICCEGDGNAPRKTPATLAPVGFNILCTHHEYCFKVEDHCGLGDDCPDSDDLPVWNLYTPAGVEVKLDPFTIKVQPADDSSGVVCVRAPGKAFHHASCQCSTVFDSDTMTADRLPTISYRLRYAFAAPRLTLECIPDVLM